LVGLTGAAPGADQADLADRLLQEALTKELVEQDPSAAIKLYQQVIATAGVSTATASRAREREAALQKLAPRTPAAPVVGSSPAPRRVLDGEWTELYDMSADGRFVVGQRVVRIGTQELVVRDLATGVPRVIGMRGNGPEISDDGTRVAHGGGPGGLLITSTGPDDRSVSIVGQAGVTIGRAHDWAPDGNAVLVPIFRPNDPARSNMVEYAWVSVADQSIRSIRTVEQWAVPSGGGAGMAAELEVSPDGRFIAFVGIPAPKSQDRYLYVMDANGQTIEPVVSTSGVRGWPKWTPDSRHIVFTEEHRSGAGLWSVAVENGKAAGQPRLLYGNIGNDSALLGITRDGVLHYRRNDFGRGRYAGTASHVVPRDLATRGAQERPITFRGCCGAWSPDGERLAYSGNDGRVVVRHVQTGEERSYALPGAIVFDLVNMIRWFHDGAALVVVGADETYVGQAGNRENLNFYRIDLGTGAVRLVMNVGPLVSERAALSDDDRWLYVTRRDEPKGPFSQIVAVDLASGADRIVARLPSGIDYPPDFVLSPDGTRLAVGAAGSDYRSDGRIFTVNVDGTDFRDVGGSLPGFWGGELLRWTPDGRSLLFRSYDANEDWQIMRIPASGGAPEFDGVSHATLAPLLPDIRMVRGNFNGLDVSPDGSRLVVSTLVAPRFEVWALDLVLP
jgi:Tol biopolymer transport system component